MPFIFFIYDKNMSPCKRSQKKTGKVFSGRYWTFPSDYFRLFPGGFAEWSTWYSFNPFVMESLASFGTTTPEAVLLQIL